MEKMYGARVIAFAVSLLILFAVRVGDAGAQPVCNDAGGLVEVGDQAYAGITPINGDGLVAFDVFHNYDYRTRFFRLSNGDSFVDYGPYLTTFPLGQWNVADLNNGDAVLFGQRGSSVLWSTGATTELVAGVGGRFQSIFPPRMNDHNQVVFLGEESFPGGLGVYFAQVGSEPVRVPNPAGYAWLSVGYDDYNFLPQIDNSGTIVVRARRTSDNAIVILAGSQAGLTEIASNWNGSRFWELGSVAIVRQPTAGPVFSFIARTMDDLGMPEGNEYRLFRYRNGVLEVMADWSTFEEMPLFIDGVANEHGDYALWLVPRRIVYGRAGEEPTTVLAVGSDYPLRPNTSINSVGELRMNSVGQIAFSAAAWELPVTSTSTNVQLRYDPPGTTQCRPILPAPPLPPGGVPQPPRFRFPEVRIPRDGTGRWVDPPVAAAYTYAMLGEARFTAITDFPTGFASPFRVAVNGVELPGTYGPGDRVDFAPPGVTSFTVSGIEPGVDATRADGFPLRIMTDTEIVSFEMIPLADRFDFGVAARKLAIIDRTGAAGKAKFTFVSGDPWIAKGAGTDPASIGATFTVAYEGGATSGRFVVPAGASDGQEGWTLNDASQAAFANRAAPAGATHVKRLQVRTGKAAKLITAGRGDEPLDIIAAGPPPQRVLTALCMQNAAEQPICQCTAFSECTHRTQTGGAKLICKNGVRDNNCGALP